MDASDSTITVDDNNYPVALSIIIREGYNAQNIIFFGVFVYTPKTSINVTPLGDVETSFLEISSPQSVMTNAILEILSLLMTKSIE